MANKILLKKSGTASHSPTTLDYGEVAINYNDGKLFFRDATDSIRAFNADQYLSTLTDVAISSPASGEFLSYDGSDWTNTSVTIFADEFTADGTTASFTLSQTPSGEEQIQVFVDGAPQRASNTSLSGNVLTLGGTPANGQIVEVRGYGITGGVISGGSGASVTISDSAPSSPTTGDLWWDSTSGRLKIYYNDGSSTQWVDSLPATGTIVGDELTDGTSTLNFDGSNNLQLDTHFLPTTNITYDLGSAERKWGDIYYNVSSDINLKHNVVDYNGGLSFVNSLRVVDFVWNDYVEVKGGTSETGFIAQEIKEALDNSNYNNDRLWDTSDAGIQGIDTRQLIPALVNAIQELTEKVNELEEKLGNTNGS